jgi:hypothetical protein
MIIKAQGSRLKAGYFPYLHASKQLPNADKRLKNLIENNSGASQDEEDIDMVEIRGNFSDDNEHVNDVENRISDLSILSDEFSWFSVNEPQKMRYIKLYEQLLATHNEYQDEQIKQLNAFLQPIAIYNPKIHRRHRDILQLMDLKHIAQYYEVATDKDKARLKGLQMNGANSWRYAPYNHAYGVNFTNQQVFYLTSLVFETPITNAQNILCARCNQTMDNFGHHAINCASGGLMQARHNAVCKDLNMYLHKAGYKTKLEALHESNQSESRKARPGDILVYDFFYDSHVNPNIIAEDRNLYLDYTVANIFAESVLKKTAEERGYLTKKTGKG